MMIPGHTIERPLGSGGQTRVWLVRERTSGRLLCARDEGDGGDAWRQFALRAPLDHPGMVAVVDAVVTGTRQVLLEEYVPGPLWSERPPRAPAAILDGARGLLSVLAYLHENGVVHRDIKPENIILFDEGGHLLPVLIDFGLACHHRSETGAATGVSRNGRRAPGLSGTLGTAAPELLAGRLPGPQADLFALGATLLAAVLERSPDPRWSLEPRTIEPLLSAVPPALRPLLVGLTSIEPSRRFASARAALAILPPPPPEPRLGDALSWPLVGQDDLLERAREAFTGAADRSFVVCLCGIKGVGKRRLARRLARDDRAARAAVTAETVDLREGEGAAQIASLLSMLRSSTAPRHLVVTTSSPEDAARIRAGLGESSCAVLEPALLSASSIAELLAYLPGGTVHDPERLFEQTGGHPGSIVARIGEAADGAEAARGEPDELELLLAVIDEPIAAPLAAGDGSGQAAARGTEATPSVEALQRVAARGRVHRLRDGRYRIASPDVAARLLARSTPAARRQAHARALALLGRSHPQGPYHALLSGSMADLEEALMRLAGSEVPVAVAERRLARAIDLLGAHRLWGAPAGLATLAYRLIEAARLDVVARLVAPEITRETDGAGPEAAAIEGRLLAEQGRHDEAIARLRKGLDGADTMTRQQVRLDLARSLLAAARLDETLATLDEAVAAAPLGPLARAELERVRSLTLHRLGRTTEALAVARAALERIESGAPDDGNAISLALGLRQNMAMMTRHLGRVEEAARRFAETAQGLLRIGDIRSACAVWINAAIAYQDSGHLARAQELMERAHVTAERACLSHARDVALAGLGITLVKRGALAAGLRCLDRAGERFTSQGRRREVMLAQAHAAEARARIEEDGSAAMPAAGGGGGGNDRIAALFDEALEQGFDAEAAVIWRVLLRDSRAPRLAAATLWRLLRKADRTTREEIMLALLAARLESAGAAPSGSSDRCRRRIERLAREGLPRTALAAHLVLARSSADRGQARGHAAAALRIARRIDSPLQSLEAALVAVELGHPDRGGRGVRRAARRALGHLTEIEKLHTTDTTEDQPVDTPIRTWTRKLDALRGGLTRLVEASAPQAGGQASLQSFLRASEVIHDEALDEDRRFTAILEEAMRITSAHRGLIVTRDAGGKERCRARLRLDGEIADEESFDLSRSLLEEVMNTGRPRVTFNALEDPELRDATSVVNFKLSSIVCVPIKTHDRVIGALYLDNPYQRGIFERDAVELLQVFAAQISLGLAAVMQKREIARLNGELAQTLEERTRELEQARRELADSRQATPLVYQSDAIDQVMKRARRLALTDIPVHITGETGTGKELVARRVHELSPRRDGPFVSENCAAIPSELLESELFGHVKGAFTGAHRDKPGLFRLADGGTLFLDEVADMPLGLQGKLLRVLQEGKVRPVGADEEVTVDVRLVTATHRDLRKMVVQKRFREDLFYRVFVGRIDLPALRERREDIRPLTAHFLARHGKPGQHFDKATLECLESHVWPGNVRELESAVRCAAVMAAGATLTVDDLPESVRQTASLSIDHTVPCTNLKELERLAIVRALDETRGNRVKAAKLLGISRSSLFNKLREYQLHEVTHPPARTDRQRASRATTRDETGREIGREIGEIS